MTETLTSISKYRKDNILKERTSSFKEMTSGLVKYCYTSTGSLGIDNAYSIELMRLSVRQRLNNQFQLRNDVVELDFLVKNPKILTLVFEIRESIVKKFETSNIALELHSESSSWETLFIVVSTNAVWEESNAFVNRLFKRLFKTQPETANKINLVIAPDAI